MKDFSEKQISEFVTALKRKEIPLKLEYLGVGAKWYLDFSRIGMYKKEAMLIKNSSHLISPSIKNLNVVYTGCGNGYKIVPLIKTLLKNKKNVNVFLLDISEYMLSSAKKNLKRIFKNRIRIKTHLIDFESGNFASLTRAFRSRTDKNNLLILMGNTLGNLSERKRILTNFRESMILSDYLLLGLHLRSRTIADRLKAFSVKKVLDFVSFRLNKISPKAFSTKVFWNEDTKNIEFRSTFKNNIKINYRGEELKFKKGDSVLVCTSHLFSLKEIHSLIRYSGFKVRKKFIDENQEEIILLCQPVSL